MFEKIHFLNNPFETKDGISDSMTLHRQMEHSHSPQISDFQDTLDVMTQKTDFLFQGNIKYLMETPMSSSQQAQYLYLQGFALLNMGRQYYTSRKDYSSYLIVYTYEGEGELLYQNKHFILHPGDGFLIDCRKEHSYRTAKDIWSHADLHFNGGNAEFLYETLFHEQDPVFSCAVGSEFQGLLEQVLLQHDSVSEFREFKVSIAIQNLLLYIANTRQKNSVHNTLPENIRYLQKYMENHFRENLTLDELASLCGLSKYHLCREFKKYTYFAPKEYITRLRLNHAKLLLENTNIPAYKIGILVGIPNEANFIRLFQKNCGLTPGEYRQNVNK